MWAHLLKTIGLLLAILAMLTAGICAYRSLPSSKFNRIQQGMSISEVNAVLGTGKKLSRSQLPLVQSKNNDEPIPIISGDEFWFWGTDRLGWHAEIYIGLRNGKVCDKDISFSAL